MDRIDPKVDEAIQTLNMKDGPTRRRLLISSVLRWMNTKGTALPSERRKILGFTDNRQDAALQAIMEIVRVRIASGI